LKAKIAERSALFLAHFRPGVDMVRVAVLHRHTLEHIEMNLRQLIEISRHEKIQKIFFEVLCSKFESLVLSVVPFLNGPIGAARQEDLKGLIGANSE
jgi:hypothetical protein